MTDILSPKTFRLTTMSYFTIHAYICSWENSSPGGQDLLRSPRLQDMALSRFRIHIRAKPYLSTVRDLNPFTARSHILVLQTLRTVFYLSVRGVVAVSTHLFLDLTYMYIHFICFYPKQFTLHSFSYPSYIILISYT